MSAAALRTPARGVKIAEVPATARPAIQKELHYDAARLQVAAAL
jgi:hypothetical protein